MSQNEVSSGAILQDARMLNSDLGRFVRRCNFSTNLHGRFYQNNSMQSHNARAHRIARMKAKRKQLERSVKMEEKKIRFLEDELRKKVEKRRREENMKILMELAATKIQSHVRKMLALKRIELMRIEEQIMNYVVLIIQSCFRGKRARRHAHNLRMQLAQHRKEILASTRIQSLWRKVVARRLLLQKREEFEIKKSKASILIQANVRGNKGRDIVKHMRRKRASISIQCMYRVTIARRFLNAEREKALKKREKPKRVPLHERRYSTYAFDVDKGDQRRRFTDISSTVMQLRKFQERRRRRTSISNIQVARNSFLNLAKKDPALSDRENSDTSVQSLSKSVQSLPRMREVHDASSSVKSDNDSDDRIRKARLRASMRAAKLKKQSRVDEEEKVRRTKARKEELLKLEEKRRSVLEREAELKKQMRSQASGNKINIKRNETSQSGAGLIGKEQTHPGKQLYDNSHEPSKEKSHDEPRSSFGFVQVPKQFELNLTFCDEDFEDDIEENEDDLF